MSQTTIRKKWSADGVPVNPTSVKLSDPTGAYGVRRTDTLAVVVADDTNMTNVTTGVYTHTFSDPVDGLTYEYYVEVVYAGETYHYQGTISGGTDQTENLYNLVTRIQPYLRLCPDPVIYQQLRFVAHEFCMETGIWRKQLPSITSVANQEDYTLSLSEDAVIMRVRAVEVDEVPWDFSEVSEDGATLTLDPAPGSAGLDIDVWTSILPRESCTDYPSWLLERWGRALRLGVMYELMSMQDEPWSKNQEAVKLERQYEREKAKARRETQTLRGPAELRIQKRIFV